jgi:DNA polymerase III sliding clamp (beta) subunit (PCNA family)
MTMTTNDVQSQGVDTVVPAFTMPAGVLRDMLAGALVAAGKDKTMPALCAVRIEWDEITPVRVVSTDRYRLIVGAAVESDCLVQAGDGAFLIDRATVVDLVKALPKLPARYDWPSHAIHATVTVSGDHVVVRVDDSSGSGTWSREIRTVDGEFPKYRSLIPSPDEAVETANIAWDPDYLSDVSKIPHGKNDPVKWTFYGSTRPAVARYGSHHGVEWLYLLMPVRLP